MDGFPVNACSEVSCLYDRAKNIITKTVAYISGKETLTSLLVSNEYPSSFVSNITRSNNQQACNKEPTTEIKSASVLPYIKGISERRRLCLQKHGVRSAFKSNTTLRSHLVRLKGAVDPRKQDEIVYKISCECGKVYICETEGECMNRSMIEIYGFHELELQPFLNMSIRPGITRSGTRFNVY